MISQGNSHSVAQESSEIWADQVDLQPVSFKPDRLLSAVRGYARNPRRYSAAFWRDPPGF
jgi:hypothetical protein